MNENPIDPHHKRLTIAEIKYEIMCLFNLEKGLPHTFIELIKRPGEFFHHYANVSRKNIFNPFRYLLFGVAANTLFLVNHPVFRNFLQTSRNPLEEQAEEGGETALRIAGYFTEAQELYLTYQNFVILLAIPLISFVTLNLLSGKKQYNFAENMAINAFVFGTTSWISSFLALVTFFFHQPWIMYIFISSSLIVATYMYSKIYQKNLPVSIGGLLAAYVANIVVGLVFQVIAFTIILLINWNG